MQIGDLIRHNVHSNLGYGIIVRTEYDRNYFNHTALKVEWIGGYTDWYCEMSLRYASDIYGDDNESR